ncbi:MAG: hypothetical protein ACREGH_00655 [Minisyncoccia bacterium]
MDDASKQPEQSVPESAPAKPAPEPPRGAPDPKNIILPQKPGSEPSILSAERAPATEALAAANYETPQEIKPFAPTRLPDIPETAANALPDVPALHTFRGDMAAEMEEQHISLADIAQASVARARQQEARKPARQNWLRTHLSQLLGIILGLILIIAAIAAIAFVYLHFRAVPSKIAHPNAPYLYVDSIKTVSLTQDETRDALMSTLAADEKNDSLSVGLVEQLALTVASTTPGASMPMTAQQFFALVAQAPDSLVRALNPQFLLGLYAGEQPADEAGDNEPFVVFKTDSYDQAFAGMLSWEHSMQKDLSPLFGQEPSAAPENAPAPTATATSSAASTTAATSTAPGTTPINNSTSREIIGTSFVDDIIDNHDVRALKNSRGNTLFFWTFVDSQTLVITTDAQTLQELISRIQNAPTMTIPGASQ